MSNKVSNTGVIASDVTGVGTARNDLTATNYGGDKGAFAYGINGAGKLSIKNLVNSSGVIGSDVTGVGTQRGSNAAAGFSFST